jgi:hypothetical protein
MRMQSELCMSLNTCVRDTHTTDMANCSAYTALVLLELVSVVVAAALCSTDNIHPAMNMHYTYICIQCIAEAVQ